ncbi:MAG: PTS glucose transporter subunit IIA, partial [Limisphaerales bacterium]
LILSSPIKGKVISLEEVNDGVFSEHMLGDGLAFVPSEGIAYAPCHHTQPERWIFWCASIRALPDRVNPLPGK